MTLVELAARLVSPARLGMKTDFHIGAIGLSIHSPQEDCRYRAVRARTSRTNRRGRESTEGTRRDRQTPGSDIGPMFTEQVPINGLS